MTTPNLMPRKTNPIHQQALAGLVATKPVTTTFKKLRKGADGKDTVIETKQTRQGLRFPLAQNVTEENVDRAAKRWIA